MFRILCCQVAILSRHLNTRNIAREYCSYERDYFIHSHTTVTSISLPIWPNMHYVTIFIATLISHLEFHCTWILTMSQLNTCSCRTNYQLEFFCDAEHGFHKAHFFNTTESQWEQIEKDIIEGHLEISFLGAKAPLELAHVKKNKNRNKNLTKFFLIT